MSFTSSEEDIITIEPCNFLIEGTIGAGKSTFLERLKNLPLDTCLIPEPVDIWTNYKGHNYLNLFYQDTQKYAFPFQQLAINTAVNAYKKGVKENPNSIRFFERSLFSPVKIFGKEQYNAGTLSQAEYDLHSKITEDISEWVDYDIKGIIYVKTSAEIAQQRVIKRSRKEDSTIPLEYLKNLHDLHEQWLTKDQNIQYPVLTFINDSSCTIDNFEKVESAILEWIQKPSKLTIDPSKL